MTARLRIDLGALVANYARCRNAARPGTSAAVVKADAYGLGAEPVARALWAAGCRDFFVATAAEGTALRGGLPEAAIYVFEGARSDSVAELLAARLVPVLNHPAQLELWRRAAGGRPAAVHVDTGMNRLGFPAESSVDAFSGVNVCLLVTHLACADQPDHPMNRRQLERLASVRRAFPGVPVSVGNAAALLCGGELVGDLGRPGIGLYGGNPYLGRPNPMRPVVTLEGRILQIRQVRAGESIGYGAAFTAREDMRVAVVGLGYADGLPRLLSNRGEAAFGGRRCPIVGRISMDLTTVDVSAVTADVDDWVEFIGPTIPVDQVAEWAETIGYEVLTGLGRRPHRIYLQP
ncbi:MAG TPA: alanine racemase [Pseudomonadales bacterium]